MLVQFKVKNFKSFRDEQTLSMVASSDKTLPDNVFATEALGGKNLVRSAVLYGANASGKSNLIDAIGFVMDFVKGSTRIEPGGRIPVQPFRLDKDSARSPSEFELTFIHEGIRYQYGFSVDHQRVREEWLIAFPQRRPQTWFERTWTPNGEEEYDWYFGPGLKGEKNRLAKVTRPNVLLLTVAAEFNHEQLSEVYRWFSLHLRVVNATTMDTTFERLTARQALEDDSFYTLLQNFLQIADLGIVDLTIQESPQTIVLHKPDMSDIPISSISIRRGTEYDIQLVHQAESSAPSAASFSIEDVSLGTRRLFGMGFPWIDTLRTGCILVVDELDSSLHPSIVRAMVKMFHNSTINARNAQLVFNTHDVTLLDTSLFRRDQVWFVEKDTGGASHLYPLLDYGPRKHEALEKGYLMGRYGAIPFLREELLEVSMSDGEE